MIEKIKCKCCSYKYEVIWGDTDDDYYEDEEDKEEVDKDEEELFPEYCPFCGSHCEYVEE
jgi:hypothetical protein